MEVAAQFMMSSAASIYIYIYGTFLLEVAPSRSESDQSLTCRGFLPVPVSLSAVPPAPIAPCKPGAGAMRDLVGT